MRYSKFIILIVLIGYSNLWAQESITFGVETHFGNEIKNILLNHDIKSYNKITVHFSYLQQSDTVKKGVIIYTFTNDSMINARQTEDPVHCSNCDWIIRNNDIIPYYACNTAPIIDTSKEEYVSHTSVNKDSAGYNVKYTTSTLHHSIDEEEGSHQYSYCRIKKDIQGREVESYKDGDEEGYDHYFKKEYYYGDSIIIDTVFNYVYENPKIFSAGCIHTYRNQDKLSTIDTIISSTNDPNSCNMATVFQKKYYSYPAPLLKYALVKYWGIGGCVLREWEAKTTFVMEISYSKV